MMQKPTLKATWLPLGLAVFALLLLNVGLYTRLSAGSSLPTTLSLPYTAEYDDEGIDVYQPFGGDWAIRDEMLLQLSTSGSDLGTLIPLAIPADQSYFFEVDTRFLGGAGNGAGIIFNAQQTTSRQQAHMARFNLDGGRMWLIYGYFGQESDFIGQGSAGLEMIPDATEAHQLRVEVNADRYAVLVDGERLATDIPLEYQGGAVGLISSASQVAFDNVHVDVLTQTDPAAPPGMANTAPSEADISGELVFSDGFDGPASGESLWVTISGDWQFEAGALVQTLPDGYDYSIGHRVVLDGAYQLRVQLTHRQGLGGGVLFNMPQPDSKNGAHMLRYVDDVIAWGYFDAEGVFQGQGSVVVPSPGDTVHNLEITAEADHFAAWLDGVRIAENVPLASGSAGGHIGLTASQSVVAFDEVSVFQLDRSDFISSEIDLTQASGSWVVRGGVIVQTQTDAVDTVAGTGVAAATFSLSVDILLPLGRDDAGAGVIFHMMAADDPGAGHMVRLGQGGREVFWGVYDGAGVFQGQGDAPLELTPGEIHRLTIISQPGTYDILVDGIPVIQAVPTQRESGWLGLISYGGPVEFSNIELSLR